MSHYTIQSVPLNLSKEETIVQIVEVLDHLNDIAQDIFCRVNKRLEENTQKLTEVSARIDVASSKIERLKDDKRAKTVFSSSKYPASDVNKAYKSIFDGDVKVERVRHKVTFNKHSSTYEPWSKLQFFHVKNTEIKSQIPEGLGKIPDDIHSINNLLLSNTGRNIYMNFKSQDLQKEPHELDSQDYYATSELGPAPPSIGQRSLHQTNKAMYFYRPKIEELTDLDVPFDLPDLPGIADDVRYDIGDGSSSKPSFLSMDAVSELDLPNLLEVTENLNSAPQNPPSPPPPPVLQPPKVEKSSESVENNSQIISQPKKVIAQPFESTDSGTTVEELPGPPPAPPPPPPPSIPSIDNSRANLMDAIRKAGGSQKANLRKTSHDSMENKTAKGVVPSGDLMADLHSKLMMRRKGISGSKNQDQSNVGGGDSAFARLSSIIPPPVKTSDVGSGVSTDDDAWNDDD